MKKLTVLSMIVASLLLTACGNSATGAEAKAYIETKTEAPMKCGEGKCGGAGKCGGEKKSAITEAKDAVANAAEKVKAAAAQKATEAADAVKEKAAAVDSAKEAAGSAAVASAVDTGAGKGLYAKCAGCHGADGKTKAMGKAPVLAGQSAADLEAHLKAYKAGTRNEHGMGMLMKGQVASMSDDDIKAVAAYIASF